MNKFKKYIYNLEEEVIKMQREDEPREFVSDEDVAVALIVLNILSYKNIADCFLGCAAVNLINSYAKQSKAKLNYGFKKHLITILKGIDDLHLRNVIKVTYDNRNNDHILLISFWRFQFSYKSFRLSEQLINMRSQEFIEWDGIRKQPYALTIFNAAYNCPMLSEKTQGGADFLQKVENELDLYNEGAYKFIHGNLHKVKKINRGPDFKNKEKKNYYRSKLLECKRPVIVSGKFVKIWNKHVTFITIRPFLAGNHALTICNHINIRKNDLESVINLDSLVKGHRYYLIGHCREYGNGRMGINLAKEVEMPIFPMGDSYKYLSKDVLSVCHNFSVEEYYGKSHGHFRL